MTRDKLEFLIETKEPYQYTKISDYKYCQYCGSREDENHEVDCLYKAVEEFLG